MKHQENLSITGKIRSFQRQRITTNITKPLSPSTNLFKDIKTARRKGITTKITRNTQITMLPSMLRRTIQNHRNSKNLQKKLAHSSLRKVYVLKRYFFGKVKITALIDSGSTVSFLRENTSRRIMDPTKLSKNKMLLTGIGEAQVTTIGFFEHEFKIDDENYSLTWHVVPADKLKFEQLLDQIFWNKHR
ncbi:RVP domain-containing protein [Trichonephila clavipes]|nr:RVP domain-containing protein [Trichonephila clavipes]